MCIKFPCQSIPRETQTIIWLPPPHRILKLNTDVYIQLKTRVAYGRGLFRNNSGMCITGFVCNIGYCSVPQAEAWALLHGLRIAWCSRIPRLHAGSDNETLVNIILNKYHSPASCHSLTKSIKNEFMHFSEILISHIYRERPTFLPIFSLIMHTVSTMVYTYSSPPDGLGTWLLHDSIGVISANLTP